MFVEWASLLVHHDPVLVQGVVADAVELPGKVAFGRSEGIVGVHDDQVIFIRAPPDKPQRVVKIDVHAAVIQLAGILRQPGPAGFYHLSVHFHQVNALHRIIAGQFLHHPAVPGADHQDVLHVLVNGHGDMGDHLVVNEFIPFRQHHVSVQGQHPAEFRGDEDVDLLVLAFPGVQVPVYPQAVLNIRGMAFTEPEFHETFSSSLIMLIFSIIGSSGPVTEHPFAFA